MTSATDKQRAFIARLLTDRDLSQADPRLVADAQTGELTAKAASRCIDHLLALPPQARQDAPAEPGFYMHDGQVYRVQQSRSSERLYALRLDTDARKFVYAPGMIRSLTAEERLTQEQAAAFGHHYGICAMCAATLTDPVSVQRGYGPVCATKL